MPDRTPRGIGYVLRHAARYWRPHALAGVLLIALVLVQQAYGALVAYSLKVLVDRAIPARDLDTFTTIVVLLAGAWLVAGVAQIAMEIVSASVAGSILTELRARLFRHTQSLSLAFFSRHHSADLLARFTSDLGEIERGVTSRIVDAVMATVGLLIYLPFLFALDARLAAVVVAGLPFVILAGNAFTARAGRAKRELRAAEGAMAAAVAENVRTQAVVKLFGLADRASRSFDDRLAHVRRQYVRATALAQLVGTASTLMILLFQTLVTALGAWLALHGRMAPGTLVAFVTLHAAISKQAYDLAKKVVPNLIGASAGIARLEEILGEHPEIVDADGAIALPRATADLKLERVTFGYPGEPPSLIDVDLDVPAGHSVAIVGASGSGKSTALKLMLRLYDAEEGRITFAGRDVREVTLASLHGQIGVVFQDALLVDGTIADNIALGKAGATLAEIEAAARAAEIHDTIAAFPQGYATRIGEGGGRLSGGQRQRIAIARALVRDPTLLVLDEATSALDPASEAAIARTLERLAAGRSIVSVTHRLSFARDLDRVVVMAQGRVAEQGTHAELVARGGVYAGLWRKQSGVGVTEAGTPRVDEDWLRDIPLLAGAPHEMLESVAAGLELERIEAGKIVFEKGAVGDKLYIVARGKAEVVTDDRVIAVLSDGEFFGELALLHDTPRSHTVRTATPCWFLTLAREKFTVLLDGAPALREEVHRVAAARTGVIKVPDVA